MIPLQLLLNPSVSVNLIYIYFLAGVYFPLLYFLPLRFQAIDSDTATHSGLRLIPLILSVSIFTILSNTSISLFRTSDNFWLYLLLSGSLLATMGTGLLYAFPTSSSGQNIGFQILTGVGIGIALQVPMVVNQALVSITAPADIPTLTAVTLFFEIIGAALFTATGDAIFENRMSKNLDRLAPNVDGEAVLRAGAMGVSAWGGIGEGDRMGVMRAFEHGLGATMGMGVGCSVVSVVIAGVIIAWDCLRRRQIQAREGA